MVCTTSQQTAGQKDSHSLIGEAVISGTSWSIRSKLGVHFFSSQTLRFVREIVRKEGDVIDKEEPGNLGHDPICVILWMSRDAE